MTLEDIKRLNCIYYSSFRPFVKNPHGLLVCYILFILRCIGYLFFYFKKQEPIKEILFLAFSINNKKSLRTIIDNLSPKTYTIWKSAKKDIPKGKVFFKSIKYFPLFQRFYNSSSIEDKRLIRTFYQSFMATCGYYEVFHEILKDNPQIKMIVFANDHTVTNRCMIEVAEKHDIKTLYVQHASVTEKFPPLHFSYSFLDGLESYEKYKAIGDIKGKVFLTGSPRFDELYDYKNINKGYDIGIAINRIDSYDKVMSLCKYLQDNVTKSIVVRPHPGMIKHFNTKLFKEQDLEISDSTQESSFSFLSKIHFLIANESSIHLDSALVGVPSLLYNFSENGNIIDWYSYVKMGMIDVCDSYEDVVKVLNKQHDIPIRQIQYYNASFQTPIEGNVGKYISEFIKKNLFASEKESLQMVSKLMDKTKDYYYIKH